MRDLYTHMRNIYLITRTLEQRMALLPSPRRLQFIRGLIGRRNRRDEQTIVDGFKFINGEIHAVRAAHFPRFSRAGSCAFFSTRSNAG